MTQLWTFCIEMDKGVRDYKHRKLLQHADKNEKEMIHRETRERRSQSRSAGVSVSFRIPLDLDKWVVGDTDELPTGDCGGGLCTGGIILWREELLLLPSRRAYRQAVFD